MSQVCVWLNHRHRLQCVPSIRSWYNISMIVMATAVAAVDSGNFELSDCDENEQMEKGRSFEGTIRI